MMNTCDDRHEPEYQIKYKPAPGKTYNPIWRVCKHCYDKRPFGSDDYVESITKLEKLVK